MATEPVAVSTITKPVFLPRIWRHPAWLTSACILLADIFALALVSCSTVFVRHLVTPKYHVTAYMDFLPFLLMILPAFLSQGLYPGLLIHPAEEMRRIFYSLCAVFLVWAAFTFLWRTGNFYSRSVFLIVWAVGSPIILLSRYIIRRTLGTKPWWGVPAVVLGSGPAARRIIEKLRNGMLGIKIAGVFSESEVLSWDHSMPPILGDLGCAPTVAGGRFASYAIIAMPEKTRSELRDAIEDYCLGFSHVLLVPDMPGICSIGITAREISGELGLELPQRLFHKTPALVKRTLDFLASTLLLVTLAPLFAAIAIAIKLTSQGPVFYGHARYGRQGKTFKALKFRTMVRNADTVLARYLANHPEYLAEWQCDQKLRNDPRITRVGKWLRRYSLDELPQLLNVFIGQMSLVGPRPIILNEIVRYGRGYGLYTRVLPGITGLWQVSGRNNTTYQERVAFDEYYVHNWSVWLDLYILIRTVKVVITAEGAY